MTFMKLIDKSVVVAEIKRYKHKADERLKIKGRSLAEDSKDSALQNLCGNLLHFLDTLEVREVDLEKEIKFEYNPIDGLSFEEFARIAKHFFELGLKAQKGEKV